MPATPGFSQTPAPPKARTPLKYQMQDMTSHPLAGTEVEIEVISTDALGQKGSSVRKKITLPQRNFKNPLSRAIGDLRRTLALDSGASQRVAGDLASLIKTHSAHAQNTQTRSRLLSAQSTLANATDDEVKDRVVHDLWQIMIQLEEEMITKAEKDLRDAERELREAIEKGLTGEELRKIMEKAQKAMEKALQEKADQSRNDPDAKKDFEEMRKMMEEMRKFMEQMKEMGPQSAEQLQQQMQQMQQMQQNGSNQQMRGDMKQGLRQMQQQMQQMQQQQQLQQAMKELEEIIRAQEQVRSRTDEENKKNPPPESKDPKPSPDIPYMMMSPGHTGFHHASSKTGTTPQVIDDLGQEQKDVGRRLDRLKNDMRQKRMDPGKLDNASSAMTNAAGQLDQKKPSGAIPEQDKALEALREQMKSMQQQLQMIPGSSLQHGEKGGKEKDRKDPVARNQRDPLGADPAKEDNRTRAIRDEIREKLNNPALTRQEREYLEKLLGKPAEPRPSP